MRKSLLVRLAVLLLIAMTLPGCIWFVDDDGYNHGGGRGGGRGGGHGGDNHGDRR